MHEIFVGDIELTKWFWTTLGSAPPFPMVVGWRDEHGEPVGGFAVDHYTGPGGSCSVHFAGRPGWITRKKLVQWAGYTFDHLKCQVAFGYVSETQPDVIDLDKRIGYSEVGRLEGYFSDGSACILLQIRRDDCWWWRESRGIRTPRPDGRRLS